MVDTLRIDASQQFEELFVPAVKGGLAFCRYQELRGLAPRKMRLERVTHTLQPTDLVLGAYLKLAGPSSSIWPDRANFFSNRYECKSQLDLLVRRGQASANAEWHVFGGVENH